MGRFLTVQETWVMEKMKVRGCSRYGFLSFCLAKFGYLFRVFGALCFDTELCSSFMSSEWKLAAAQKLFSSWLFQPCLTTPEGKSFINHMNFSVLVELAEFMFVPLMSVPSCPNWHPKNQRKRENAEAEDGVHFALRKQPGWTESWPLRLGNWRQETGTMWGV